MNYYVLPYIYFWFLLQLIINISNGIRYVPGKRFNNYMAIVKDGYLKDGFSKNRLDCYQMCLSEASCKSFNYRKSDRTCQFVNIPYPDLISDDQYSFTVAEVIHLMSRLKYFPHLACVTACGP